MSDADPVYDQDSNIKDDPSIHLTDERINEILTPVRLEDADTVVNILDELNTCQTADLLSKVPDEDRDNLIRLYGENLDAEIFTELDPELRRKTLCELSAQDIANILADLDSDDALDLIVNLDQSFQQDILRHLTRRLRVTLEEGLNYPEDSAGRLMQREFVAIPQFWSVGKTIDYMRTDTEDLPDDFFDVFVIDPSYHVVGEIALNRLIRARRPDKVADLAMDSIHPIPATMDQEEVAHIFRRENLVSAPVVDEAGRLIGVITIDDVIDVIDEEAQEDILKLAGVDQGDLYRAILSTTRTRFGWLFINLLTAILASIVISFFDATIEQVVALAILMPIVASMGGNAGTQALTVAVRALATKELSSINTSRIIWKETLVGTLNGAAFAAIAAIATAFWFQSIALGLVIASAMVITLIVAGVAGAAIPIVLNRMGRDPAVSSTVFLTTVTDIVGFFVFLGLAAIFII